MINIKELSVGNWVSCEDNGNYQILAVNKDSVWLDKEDRKVYTQDMLEPIPITPEILEKNGWEVRVNDINPKQRWIAYLVGEDAFIFKDIKSATLNTNTGKEILFRYVHQLQNALTLCGINKEIKL